MPKFLVKLYNRMDTLKEGVIDCADEKEAREWGQKQAKELRAAVGIAVRKLSSPPDNSNSQTQPSKRRHKKSTRSSR